MTDWRQVARAMEPEIPSDDIEKAVPVLEALEAAFRELQKKIPAEADVWTAT